MGHFVERVHLPDRRTLGRVNSALMYGLIGAGLASCVFGATIYDVGRLFSVW
jgi:hypothetical protein